MKAYYEKETTLASGKKVSSNSGDIILISF